MSESNLSHSPNVFPARVPTEVERGMGRVLAEEEPDYIGQIVTGVDPSTVNEDVLEDLIDQHPVAQELATRLRAMRASINLSPAKEREYVDNIRGMRQEIGTQIQEKLGIVRADPEREALQAERERLRALGEILISLTHEETEDELLHKFGLVDENGAMTEQSMHSPLFRGDTRGAFNRYLRFAVQFDAMEQAERLNGIALKNTIAASNMRGEAHNTVARLVQRDLGLPFEAARRFIAKARDARVPGLQEKTSYSTLLRGEKLATKFGNDAAAFTRESLGNLIDRPMDHEKNNS